MRKASGTMVLAMAVLLIAPCALYAQAATDNSQQAQNNTSTESVTHEATGTVTAVEPNAHPQTVVIQSKAGNQDMTIGADVFNQTKISQGSTEKSLNDVKVGDRVWIRWTKTPDTLIADSIRILAPAGQTQG